MIYSLLCRCIYFKKSLDLEVENMELKKNLEELQSKYNSQMKEATSLRKKLDYQKSYRGKLELIIKDLKKEHKIANEVTAIISVNIYCFCYTHLKT